MSMDTCKKCGHFVDTDFDTDCYMADSCICENCRELIIDTVEMCIDRLKDDPKRTLTARMMLRADLMEFQVKTGAGQ